MKVRAFTIIELTVTLIVLSITMAIGYYCFHLIQQQTSSFKHRGDFSLATQQLIVLVKKDIDRASEIMIFGDSVIVMKYQQAETRYSFNKTGIVRSTFISHDLFELENSSFKVEYLKNDLKYIDKLTILIPYQGKITEFSQTKTYTAAELLVEPSWQ